MTAGAIASATGRSRRLRVLLLSGGLYYGGAERQIVQLAKHLDRARFAPILCTLDGTRTLFDLNPSPTPLLVARRRVRFDPLPFLKVGWILRRWKIDIVHCFLFDAEIIGRLMGRLGGVAAVIGSERNSDYPSMPIRERVLQVTRPLVDLLIANSHAGKRYATTRLGFPQDRVAVVHNGVDTERFRPRGRALARARLGLRDDQRVVGMFASFKEQKNHAMYFRVARRILDRRPGTRFLCVGHTPSNDRSTREYAASLRRLSAELRLDDHLSFLTDRGDVDELYPACDVTVLTSRREGTPNVVLESMACGVPVIATDVADNALILDDASGGGVVPLDDDEAMCARVSHLLGDEASLRESGLRARTTATERFSLAQWACSIGSLYEATHDGALGRTASSATRARSPVPPVDS
jgi:glycosyltransferase involved in cell wall biosynthesis